MEKTRKQIILNILERFKDKNVLVIGDSILDISVYGTAIGLSLETPTLKAKEEKTEYSFGGASNLVQNILELGARCSFITLLGDDSDSQIYIKFEHPNFKLYPLIEHQRKTTTKKRFWVEKGGAKYKHFQLDKFDNSPLKQESEEKVREILQNSIKDLDIIVISDYRHGIMSKSLIDSIKLIAKQNNKPVIASSQVSESKSNHLDYSESDLICMNLNEAKCIDPDFSINTLKNLSNILNSNICITLGKQGSIICLKGNEYSEPGIEVEEKDSCGAGDSFLAAFSLSDPINNPEQALLLANIWAGLSVQKYGTPPPKKQELIDYINNL